MSIDPPRGDASEVETPTNLVDFVGFHVGCMGGRHVDQVSVAACHMEGDYTSLEREAGSG